MIRLNRKFFPLSGLVTKALVLVFAVFATATHTPLILSQVTNATGAIQGTITDSSGAAVPQARITLTQPSTFACAMIVIRLAGKQVRANYRNNGCAD